MDLGQLIEPEILDSVQDMAEWGVGELTMAANLGYTASQWEEAKGKYPDISDAIRIGLNRGIENVTRALYEEAIDPKGSVAAKKAYLQAKDPANWREVKALEVSGELKVGAITEKDAEVVKGVFDKLTG